MAAVDTFQSFNASLSDEERLQLRELIHQFRTELLAARSEDARTRIVDGYIREVHDYLQKQ